MSDKQLANEDIKATIENNVSWFLADKQDVGSILVTKKFLTNDNHLVYLTTCTMPETNVPRVKIQVFNRVDGGVHETSYHLYGDHRFERFDNDMIFGNQPTGADGSTGVSVTQAEADMLIALLASLQTSARQTL